MKKAIIALGNFLFSVREIFQRKSFWFILVTLFFGACVYPPFRLMTEAGLTAEPKWDFILTTLPTPYEVPEIDWEMLLIEAIIAIPLAIAISLIFYSMKTALRRIDDKRLGQHYLSRRLQYHRSKRFVKNLRWVSMSVLRRICKCFLLPLKTSLVKGDDKR